jgi:hypothetical protein
MQDDLECTGKIRLGTLPQRVIDRLAQFDGNWLEFTPEENTLVVRHVQPIGCPAVSGIPCELVSLLELVPILERDAAPGGDLFIMGSNHDQLIRITVQQGEIRIQWAHPNYSRAIQTTLDQAMADFNPQSARINGWASFASAPSASGELQAFIDRFEGLYPEGDVRLEFEEGKLNMRLSTVNIGPQELIIKLQDLAHPVASLEAELDVSSFAPTSPDHLFRILIRQGQTEVQQASLWNDASS